MQYEQTDSLPIPDSLSQAHSQRVSEHLRQLIRRSGGYIGFANFMHEALYAPGLGYYTTGTTKFGESGDFVTAPEVSSVFGRVLARQLADVLAAVDDGEILEYGAGSGKLAVDILTALEELDALPSAYLIVEVSAELSARQQDRIQTALPHLASRVKWLAVRPTQFRGVIVANEVLDALPVERFVRRASGVRELGVVVDGDGFAWSEGPANKRLTNAVTALEADLGGPLENGFTSEVSLASSEWIKELAEELQYGVAFLFDYGVSRREYYAPDRASGWLRCHFRHHAHSNPLLHPGIQDLTSWVDFSAVASAAVAGGLDILGYLSQAKFLLGGGLDVEMRSFDRLPAAQQIALSGQIKTLTLPGEMGENFKCIAVSRGDTPTPSAFRHGDRTHTL